MDVDRPYDFTLQDVESNPSLTLGFVLAEEDVRGDSRKKWREFRVPPLSPRRSSGPLNWTHKDPISDFVFSQDSWNKGAFQPYYRDDDPSRYAKSDGVDLRWEGVAALGGRRGPIRTGGTTKSRIESNLFIANGDWEEGQVVGWSAASGTTATVNTSVVRNGNYSGQLVVAQSTAAGDSLTQSVPNPTVYRSREITVIAYLRRAAGSDAGVFLRIDDGVATQDSSAVTTDAWTYVSATMTVDSGASALTKRIRTDAETTNAAHTFRMDDCFVIPTGGVQATGKAIRASTDPDEAYVAIGRCVCRWSETTYTWEAVYINATSVVTDMIEYNDVIYIAFGESSFDEYVYGSGTSWTVAAINATSNHQDNHARYWVKARNGYGEWALWKAGPSTAGGTERNAVAWSTDPQNTGAWNPTTYFTVGSTNRYITGLFPFRDTFVVLKVDGVWVWDDVTNDFIVLTPEWEHSVDEDNGARGQAWHGDLYISTIRQGFFQFEGDRMRDLSPLLMAPRLTDFGGRITALTACARELIMGLDTPTADTTVTKTARLVRFRTENDGRQVVHTTQEPTMALIDVLTLHRDTRLWAFGRTYDSNLSGYVPHCNVWIEPDKVAAPYADVTPSIEQSGWFETSIWNGGMPETDKAFIALTIWGEDIDETHTIKVDFGRDGRAANNFPLGTFDDPSRVQTLFFKDVNNPTEEAQGRFVQLRFTFETDDTTSPKLYAFALHSQLVPEPIRAWEVDCYVGGGTLLRTGVRHELSEAEIEDAFTLLDTQIFPITLTEDFGNTRGGEGEEGARVHQVRIVDYERLPESGETSTGQERWRLLLQEVSVTA